METANAIQAREQERLKQMTFYCFTNDCLRAYILRYFVEYGEGYCGNCSNCLTQFEEKDMTETASKLIACIKNNRRAYGLVTIADIVHGSRNTKILRAHLDQNPYYGSCKDIPIYLLRQVLNSLVIHGNLKISDGEYRVLEFFRTKRLHKCVFCCLKQKKKCCLSLVSVK